MYPHLQEANLPIPECSEVKVPAQVLGRHCLTISRLDKIQIHAKQRNKVLQTYLAR